MKFQDQITAFDPISLTEMDEVKLMNRADTKYVLTYADLSALLNDVLPHYRILDVNGVRSSHYKTLYFDTVGLQFYLNHQNEKKNRYKIRYRKYVDSELCFLEIKFKNNKDRTIKSRVRVDDFETVIHPDRVGYIKNITGIEDDLVPKLWNSFNRITLVNKVLKERLTIDYNLEFEFDGQNVTLQNVAIAELKQERANRMSAFAEATKKRKIRPISISKYCIGSALLNKNLKANNFKAKILTLNKLENGLVA
jgi:hypothetical protein